MEARTRKQALAQVEALVREAATLSDDQRRHQVELTAELVRQGVAQQVGMKALNLELRYMRRLVEGGLAAQTQAMVDSAERAAKLLAECDELGDVLMKAEADLRRLVEMKS